MEGIQLAVSNLKDSKTDEFAIFGQFVAAEIKRLPNDVQRQQLKRTIQRSIMDFNEKVCLLSSTHSFISIIHSFLMFFLLLLK